MTDNSQLDTVVNPQWLLSAPDGQVPPPPVSVREQLLPFGALGWQDFERLCLRVASGEGDAEHWQLYGTAGQEQGGIDIFVRRASTTRYSVWQAKRHKRFGAADLKRAVDRFLDGEWSSRSDHFTLCIGTLLDDTKMAKAVEAAAVKLRRRGITFVPMDAARLSRLLKDNPEVVDDFFDRPWTERFCGKEAAAALGERLPRSDFTMLRRQLHSVYESHFATIDPGVLRAATALDAPPPALPLSRRFVPLDLVTTDTPLEFAAEPEEPEPETEPDERDGWSHRRAPRRRRRIPATASSRRTTLAEWSDGVSRAVVFGAPGAGKSTLLRFLALDLLADQTSLTPAGRRWPTHFPILLSFPFWTRLIQNNPPGASISVPGAVRAWFETIGATQLAKSIERAFTDGRVVLLVDGIDEWSDETAAATALSILHTFVATYALPTIVTSRPHGSKVLGALDASWTRHVLAPMSIPQQKLFALAWFEWLAEAEGSARLEAATRAGAFVDMLQRTPEVARLAAVPLLMGGLMALTRDAAGNLPRSRFEAYQELATRLLERHPESRLRAALAPSGHQVFSSPSRRQALAALAFELQRRKTGNVGLEAMPLKDAIAFCKAAIAGFLDLPADRARAYAAELLAVGAEATGILIERAPGEIGFFHRAFQEVLAAEHISGLDLNEQTDLFAQHGHDPQWQDVLLFTAQFARRASEVDRFVETLEAIMLVPPAAGDRDLLVAEIAFGRVRRTPQLTQRLATRFLSEIEHGQGVAPRAKVLRLALGGLLSDQPAVHVQPRLARWFPSRHLYHYHDALERMTLWNEPGVDDALLRCLQADLEQTRRHAAQVYAKRNAGSPGTAEALFQLVLRPPSIEAAAAAVRSLALGWPEDARTIAVVDEAAQSPSWVIALAGLEARIAAGRHTLAERDRLIEWVQEDQWERTEAIAPVLAAGWPGDPAIKPALSELFDAFPFTAERAFALAAQVFPADPDIAQRLLEYLGKPGLGVHKGELADLIAAHFPGNVELAHAVMRNSSRHDLPYRLSLGARIAPTGQVRARLLHCLERPDALEFWAVGALLHHWPDDTEVRAALQKVLEWEPKRMLRVAEQLPTILGDSERAVALLRSLVPIALQFRPDSVVSVLNALAGLKALPDTDLVGPIMDAYSRAEAENESPEFLLIALTQVAPFDERVRALAREWLRRPSGLIGVLAMIYDEDPEIRREVVELCAPLPAEMRVELADALSEIAVQCDAALAALAEGQSDGDELIASEATVRYAAALRARGPVPEAMVNALEGQLQAKGVHLEGRRLTALAALTAAGRFDVVRTGARTELGLQIGFEGWRLGTSEAVFEVVAAHWPQVEAFVATGRSWLRVDDVELVQQFQRYADSNPALAHAVEGAATRLLAETKTPVAALDFLMRDPARRSEVLAKAVSLLGGTDPWYELEASLGAASLIAQRFGGRDEARMLVEASLDQGWLDGPLAVLCDGWPDSDRLQHCAETLRADPNRRAALSIPVQMKLAATKSTPERLVSILLNAAERMRGTVWEAPQFWVGTVQRRIADDEDVREHLWSALAKASSPNQKVSLAILLAKGAGMDERLRSWCVAEVARVPDRGLGATGLDVTRSRPVLIAKRLGELLG